MRATARVLALIAAFSLAAPALALPQIHAIVADEAPAYGATVAAVRESLAGRAELSEGGLDTPVPDDAIAVVAVGAAAASSYVAAGDPRPLFATLLPSASWSAIVAAADSDHPRTAVWLDQPLARQIAFIRILLPPLRELGVLYGPESGSLADELHATAAARQMRVIGLVSEPDSEINGAVTDLLRRSEALLALPDPAVYNRYNVQSVLLASFRARHPVIGFSESWVHAGALAAIHTTPAQLGEDLGGVIGTWLDDGAPLPPARAPARWTITVNRQVAFSLGVHVPPDGVLVERLRTALEDRR